MGRIGQTTYQGQQSHFNDPNLVSSEDKKTKQISPLLANTAEAGSSSVRPSARVNPFASLRSYYDSEGHLQLTRATDHAPNYEMAIEAKSEEVTTEQPESPRKNGKQEAKEHDPKLVKQAKKLDPRIAKKVWKHRARLGKNPKMVQIAGIKLGKI